MIFFSGILLQIEIIVVTLEFEYTYMRNFND